MKIIIMYHYVRNSSNKLPYFRYLSLENFKKQLDFLEDKFRMNHEIRFYKDNEYELLKNYIKTQWKQDHIFVKSKTVLDFQHFDTNHQRYNFLVAYNTNTKEFDGILGFILQSQYDINFKDINVWTSLWSAKKQYPSLGLKLYKHLVDVLNIKHTSSTGISEFSQKIVSLFGYNKNR
ncbi:hypothetical protein [Campylobacter insulaenigrae]|uniref:Uncharacterized protein n=1 Tax=Campylobacter insulaenigrae NCTC 12927 TaxID=1031564 RepID=A0A0A8H1B6_9BACT|nr:hypothetical protein [Campylobacter insulaenigrae]AJC87742.1 hypothetical protein CINS_0775 [Campylobacter insulaenigrae NCTC 12927]VEH94021.1 polysaccharide deacetylase [Campylobacter insulaenigrae]